MPINTTDGAGKANVPPDQRGNPCNIGGELDSLVPRG